MNAIEKKESWLNSDKVDDVYKKQIMEASDEEIKDMFSSSLYFGTAGVRSILGPGSSRLNTLTVKRMTVGVALFLLKNYTLKDCKERGVAISFDNRHYSKEFRDIAAKVLTEMGISVHTFIDPHPTPELSYTVRKLHCIGGIMITASHNTKEYNGYKFYDENGCQGVYEHIDDLIKIINELPDELEITYGVEPKDRQGSINYLDSDEDFDNEFIETEVSTSLYKDVFKGQRLTKIVFSPECGCNCKVGPMALSKAGYEVKTVPNQDFFDPDFTGTNSPNPEVDAAYEGAYTLLRTLNANNEQYNLILATDPDADRCGLAFINSKGEIERFNGNQTGALLLDFRLKTLKNRNCLDSNGYICNTFVTSSQGEKIAKMYGQKVKTTATGFKYIGDLIEKSKDEKFLFGYEESYGYLIVDFARDKDSLQSIINIADMCEYYLRQGKTLDVAYRDLCLKTGQYYNSQVSLYFKGAQAKDIMNSEVTKLRDNPPSVIADSNVITLYDYLNRTITDFAKNETKELGESYVDKTNCLKFMLKDGFIAIRPSGTEPKVKIYFEVIGKSEKDAKIEVEKRAKHLKEILNFVE